VGVDRRDGRQVLDRGVPHHRVAEQLDLDPAQQTALALLLLRGPQTPGELRSRAGRMHGFASVELVEAVLGSLAAHRFGPLVELLPREPGRREARWSHLLGEPTTNAAPETVTSAGRYRPFHDAVLAGDWDTAVAQLAETVVFHSPAVHRPYEGRETTATVLRAVSTVFEDFRYVDVLDDGDRAGLVSAVSTGRRDGTARRARRIAYLSLMPATWSTAACIGRASLEPVGSGMRRGAPRTTRRGPG
jgi:hypothetical protein